MPHFRELGSESLKVLGMDLQRCGLQEWCWLVSTVLDLVEVERQLDLSSVAARLRGSDICYLNASFVYALVRLSFLRLLRSFPTEPMTYEAHPFFFQVKESRRALAPLLIRDRTIAELGLHHQQSNFLLV
ncbi:hypothetical protein Taro_008178, partial [Colocasia esculenta]|nr:hypothetical protein [Colocasia esculenta]